MHDKNFMRETLLQGAQAFQAGKLQRRSFLALCGMAGFASASVLAGRAEAAAGEIVMWNWGGQSEECHQSAIGAAFTKDTGVPLKFDTSGPLQGKIKEMVDSGNVTADVCDADLFDAVALGKTGHLEALDYSVTAMRWSLASRSSCTATPSCMIPKPIPMVRRHLGQISSTLPSSRAHARFTNGPTGRWKRR